MINQVGAKLLSDLVIFSIFFWYSVRLPQINSNSTIKIFNVFFSWDRYLIILKYSWRAIFCTVNNLISIYQIFGQSFCWYCSTFFDSSFNSFSTSTCFVLFEVTFLFKFFSLRSKSVFFTKSRTSFLLANFARANLAAKFSDVNLLNSWVLIYLSWSWSLVIFFSVPLIFML